MAELQARADPVVVRKDIPPLDVTWSPEGDRVQVRSGADPESPTWSGRMKGMRDEVRTLSQSLEDTMSGLMRFSEARKKAAEEPAEDEEITFDDPYLSEARRVYAISTSRFQEKASSHEDVSVLGSIWSVTKTVNDDLKELLEEDWAKRVWEKSFDDGSQDGAQGGEEAAGEDGEGGSDEEDADDECKMKATPSGKALMMRQTVKVPEVHLEEIEGLPSLKERLLEVTNPREGFTDHETEHLRSAFKRQKEPGSNEIHRDGLINLLKYIGHLLTDPVRVKELMERITPYEYMDFEEFLSFMTLYQDYEKEFFFEVFGQFDEDGSGEIDIAELRRLIASLGITPLRSMLREALSVVDADNNGQLGFTELMQFLVVYRHAEGFTQEEVRQLRKIFDRLSDRGGVPVGDLDDAVIRVFGRQVEGPASVLIKELRNSEKGEPENLGFIEFLIFVRRVRETSYIDLQKEYGRGQFCKADQDNNGRISERELKFHLQLILYEPLKAVMDQVRREVVDSGYTEGYELDFDEFFDFLLIYRQRDGFMKDQVEELENIFHRFDEKGEEEIDALALSDIFRYLGYSPTQDQVRMYMGEVDENGGGTLDFREFLHLMQIHRKAEILNMQAKFKKFQDKTERVGRKTVPELLHDLDQVGSDALMADLPQNGIEFEELVVLVDMCRAEWVAKQRKKAGYTDEEVESFLDAFNRFDRDRSGEIDNMELQRLLKEFDWQPKSREEQQVLLGRLDNARANAREAGVKEVSQLGGAELTFWEFVQLARMLQKDQDALEEAKLHKLQEDLKFQTTEVDQFRQVFHDWSKPPPDAMGNIPPQDKKGATVERDSVKRKLRAIGVQITPQNADQLMSKIQALEEEGNRFTFPSFLKLMRWMVDTDFGGCGTMTSKKAKDD
jgi:Ca2+-binding EF-hand superfamily protein